MNEVSPIQTDSAVQREWWRGATIYQVYPRSFADSNGDGIGDLPGITGKLDYVASLGVDAVWLSPFFTSPMKDFGYDVADYCDVDPIFGTLADCDALIAKGDSCEQHRQEYAIRRSGGKRRGKAEVGERVSIAPPLLHHQSAADQRGHCRVEAGRIGIGHRRVEEQHLVDADAILAKVPHDGDLSMCHGRAPRIRGNTHCIGLFRSPGMKIVLSTRFPVDCRKPPTERSINAPWLGNMAGTLPAVRLDFD